MKNDVLSHAAIVCLARTKMNVHCAVLFSSRLVGCNLLGLKDSVLAVTVVATFTMSKTKERQKIRKDGVGRRRRTSEKEVRERGCSVKWSLWLTFLGTVIALCGDDDETMRARKKWTRSFQV